MEVLPKAKAKLIQHDKKAVKSMLECSGVDEFANLLDKLYRQNTPHMRNNIYNFYVKKFR